MKKKSFLTFLLVFSFQIILNAQTTTTTPAPTPPYQFPQWAKDIRRFDIIAFGVFPFAWLFTSIGVDIYRSAQHSWSDDRYYPWPMTGKNPVAWNNDEYVMALTFAGIAAITIAVIDFTIIHIKRYKAAKRARSLKPDAPVIKRITPDGTETVLSEPPSGETPAETPQLEESITKE